MAKFPKIVALEAVVSEMLANLRVWQTQNVPFEINEDESDARQTVKALNKLIVWASTFEGLVWPEGSAWGLDQMVSFIEQMDRRLKGVELRGKKPTIKPYGELLSEEGGVRWGKIKYALALETPNQITVNPCKQDGSDANGDIDRIVYLITPTGSEPNGSDLAVDDVIAYVKFRDITNEDTRGIMLVHEEGGVHWFRAYMNWVDDAEYADHPNGSTIAYAACHPCRNADGGEEDTDTDVLIQLPHGSEGDPNVVDDQVIGAIRTYRDTGGYSQPNGEWAAVTGYMDDRIGTVKEWYKPYSIADSEPPPPGWQICDGADDPQGDPVPDLRGRFKVMWYNDPVPDEFGYISGLGLQTDDLGNEGDYEAPGETAGDWYHDHDDHVHTHPSGTCVAIPCVCSMTVNDGEDTLEHSNEDHRPPWFVIPSIIRVDNSYLAP